MKTVDLTGKKILVTGVTGQVAAPVVTALSASSTVYALARFKDANARAALEAKGISTIAVDLADGDMSAIPEDVDYVLNYAVVKTGKFDYDLKANAEGVGRLMLRCKNCKGFVHFSSTAVYQYEGHAPRTTASPLGDNHRSMFPTYSISKIAAETVARFVAHQFGVPTTIARLSVPYGDNGGWPFFHVLMMQQNMAIDVHPERPNSYNPLHSDDYIGKIPHLLGVASADVTTLNFGGSQAVSIEEWCTYLGELTGFTPQFRDNPKAFGALSIDTDEMHKLIGPTQVDWRDGMRRMVQTLAPQLIKSR
jgi:UDP-glucuronate 4-epimerase